MSSSKRSISLSCDSDQAVFAKPVRFTVAWVNGEQAAWEIPNPAQSTFVRLLYKPAAATHPLSYFFGRTTAVTIQTPNGPLTAFTVPNPPPLSIAPGGQHTLETPLERDWTGHLAPGVWTVQIDDEAQKLRSNRVHVALRFTAESVDRCFAMAADANVDRFQRKEHARWLTRIQPDLPFDWPRDSDPPDDQKRKTAATDAALAAFQRFWQQEKDSPAVVERIRTINRKAGLQVDE